MKTDGAGCTDARETVSSLTSEGWQVASPWSSHPDQHYPAHKHAYDKVVVCTQGSIVFTTEDVLVPLSAGDRMDLEAGTVHEAVAGSDGAVCVEARERES